MPDIWDSFSNVVKNRITDREGFTADLYIDHVPADASLPYAVVMDGSLENWMTFSNATAGETISLRILLTNDIRGGGASTLKEQTLEVNKALHLKEFGDDDFEVVSCKRTGWVQPFKVDEDSKQWKQYVDFAVIIQYKEESNYFDDFKI